MKSFESHIWQQEILFKRCILFKRWLQWQPWNMILCKHIIRRYGYNLTAFCFTVKKTISFQCSRWVSRSNILIFWSSLINQKLLVVEGIRAKLLRNLKQIGIKLNLGLGLSLWGISCENSTRRYFREMLLWLVE